MHEDRLGKVDRHVHLQPALLVQPEEVRMGLAEAPAGAQQFTCGRRGRTAAQNLNVGVDTIAGACCEDRLLIHLPYIQQNKGPCCEGTLQTTGVASHRGNTIQAGYSEPLNRQQKAQEGLWVGTCGGVLLWVRGPGPQHLAAKRQPLQRLHMRVAVHAHLRPGRGPSAGCWMQCTQYCSCMCFR